VIELAGERERRLADALAELGRRQITSLLVEGGAELAGSLLAAGEVDQLRIFIAPIILGAGTPLAVGAGFDRVADATEPLSLDWERSGEDMLASARLREW
jgi:diaminohydroxyphosphoribosylaminopyrimidine deaminase/5-amino-6-(5-phosphoribosylamino)uracil reductase